MLYTLIEALKVLNDVAEEHADCAPLQQRLHRVMEPLGMHVPAERLI